MDFFKKVFRFKKKRSRTYTDPQFENGYKKEYGKGRYDYRVSRDDSYLDSRLAGPRFPEANTNRPMTAPSSPRGYAPGLLLRPSAAARFPEKVLARIFSFVCPHASDETLDCAEDTTTEAGCMLCDMRDLARCGAVSRSWHATAVKLQYTSIRLDSVHYCGREEELENRRNKRGSIFKKEEGPLEVPELRMRLLYRTLQENERIAFMVRFFKMPYMTRETCKADIARLVSLMPELRYCDLPEGVYSDEQSCASLKAILYTRCPDIRKMTWSAGSERSFVDLWMESPWRDLEVMILSSLKVENSDLVRVLNSLPNLQDVTLKALPWVSDAIFDPTPNPLGIFPALARLSLEDLSGISLEGLKMYLSRLMTAAGLIGLSLLNVDIPPTLLPELLSSCPSLESLSYRTTVARTLASDLSYLSSRTLKELRYEITDDPSSRSLAKPSPTYYSHLRDSLLSSSLPSLSDLYVREADFAEHLAGQASTLSHPLTVHTKSADHLDWSKFLIIPPARGGHQLEVRAVWEMPRNSLFVDDSDRRMSGFLKAAAQGAFDFGDEVLIPPSPGFRRGSDAGPRPGSRGNNSISDASGFLMPAASPAGGFKMGHGRDASYSSIGSLAPPSPGFAKKEKRSSRQDIWR
jgi:hypothetical protein